MDNQLDPLVNVDIAASTVRIDVRGTLSRASRPDLLQEIQRIRRMGITHPITVDLSRAAFVESSALAGLRIDLNAQDARMQGLSSATVPGVSLVVMAGSGQGMAEVGADLAVLPYPSQPAIAPASASFRPLSSYSSPELLAASDAVFRLLDDPAGHCGNELLAQYEAICEELSRRELFETAGMQAAGS
jgi:hypothetical protein